MNLDGLRKFGVTRREWNAMSLYGRFEQIIAWALTIAVSVVILVALFRLAADVLLTLVLGALNPLEHETFQRIFGGIMTLLIAMEFSHSILHASVRFRSVVQVRTVVLIALLALTRKLIILDVGELPASTALGLGAALLVLAVVYWVLREPKERPTAGDAAAAPTE